MTTVYNPLPGIVSENVRFQQNVSRVYRKLGIFTGTTLSSLIDYPKNQDAYVSAHRGLVLTG